MNLWDKGKVLVVLCVLSLLYTSCEEDDSTIGFPAENNLNVDYFEYDIPIEMLWVDSVRSQNLGAIYAGKFDFLEAGTVTATPYFSFTAIRYDSNISVPHNAIFKDIYLHLEYSKAISDKIPSEVSFDVLQLSEQIKGKEGDQEKVYYIEDKIPATNLVGQKTFTFYPDSLEMKLKTDSIQYFERIDLDNSLGQFYVNKLKQKDSTIFYDFDAFDSSFKGLTLVPSENNIAILGFSPVTSYITIEYTYVDDKGNEKEGSFVFRPARYFHNITPNEDEPDLSGAEFSDITCCYNSYNPATNFVYQLFGTGINIKLDLSALKQFSDTLNNPTINSAAIILNDVESTNLDQAAPEVIAMYLLDESGHRITESFANQEFYLTLAKNEAQLNPLRVGQPQIAVLDSVNKRYRFNVTYFMQEVFDDSNTPDQLLIEYAALASSGITGYSYLRRSSRYLGGIKIPKNSIKLRIYYSTTE